KSITTGKKAEASNVYRGMSEFGPASAVDGDSSTRWATDHGVTNAYLQIDLGTPQKFNYVAIEEAYPGRITNFELKYLKNNNWITFYKGKHIGERFEASFPMVKAQYIRLEILNATEGPTIYEFQLYYKD
ncbi:MAG TPA: discoidin domain-containing protein, partial [Verrucomicrobiota bacterium]|nr:discoidin domain-containing protein [Verrucomicrobiota bacterium]